MAKKKADPETRFAQLRIEHVDPKVIKGDPKNPRAIKPENRARLLKGMREFGLVQPFVLRAEDGELIGGHQRLALAIEEGYTSVPIVRVAGLSKAKAHALGLLLNTPKAQGEFVESELQAMLREVESEGSLDLSGFDLDDLKAFQTPDEDLVTVTERSVPKAPTLAWWLVAVPLAHAADVAEVIESLGKVPDVRTWATVSAEQDDPDPKRAKAKR